MSKSYTTNQGDTFDIIAFKVWGDEKLSFHLLAENPAHKGVFSFEAGVNIIIPEIETPISKEPVPPWQK